MTGEGYFVSPHSPREDNVSQTNRTCEIISRYLVVKAITHCDHGSASCCTNSFESSLRSSSVPRHWRHLSNRRQSLVRVVTPSQIREALIFKTIVCSSMFRNFCPMHHKYSQTAVNSTPQGELTQTRLTQKVRSRSLTNSCGRPLFISPLLCQSLHRRNEQVSSNPKSADGTLTTKIPTLARPAWVPEYGVTVSRT